MVIKVMVADDQSLIRESLKIILSAHSDIEVVATVEDGNHVLSSIPQTHPDLILMDIRMPGMDGVLATKEVKEHYPDIKIIILTTFDDDEFIKLFLSEGTVRNYLSTILAKLNLRDRTQLAIWSVQTGVTRRDFSKGNTE